MATISTKIRDSSWVRQTFLIPTKGDKALVDDVDKRNAFFTSAKFKFANTALGGTLAINPPPQYTPNADRRVPTLGMLRNKNDEPAKVDNSGTLGRYYSEAVDDNSRVISLRFGQPQFNSLSSFFTGFYNYNAGLLARTGRAGGAFYIIGRAAGYVVPIIVWPLFVLNLGADMIRFFLNKPRSRYYYSKPAMPLYWNAVSSLVNQMAVYKGIVPRVLKKDDRNSNDPTNVLDSRYPFTEEQVKKMSGMMGDVIMENGQINVYAMATRYQRLARNMYKKMQKLYEESGGQTDLHSIMQDIYNNNIANTTGTSITGDSSKNLVEGTKENPTLTNYLDKWFKYAQSQPRQTETPKTGTQSGNTGTAQNTSTTGQSTNTSVSADTESAPSKDSDVAGFWDFVNAELDDGSNFVTFRVDNDSTASESFSNQTGDSEIAGKINSMSGQSRETRFNFAGGNLGDGVIASSIEAVGGAIKDFLGGVADSLMISGIAALGGSAFVDIPKHWTGSSANLPRMSYSFSLVSPYGNKLSQLMFMYVPLCMILAGSLPLSTGKQSYTSPFLVEVYDRGRAQTRLGIIDSLSITRGTTHLGFNNSGQAMGIDVSFTIQDLSSVLHMPLIQGFQSTFGVAGSGAGLFDDDTVFSDYMAILGSLTVNEQTYAIERLRLRLTSVMANINTWASTAHFANWVTDLAPFQLASAFYSGRVNR